MGTYRIYSDESKGSLLSNCWKAEHLWPSSTVEVIEPDIPVPLGPL